MFGFPTGTKGETRGKCWSRAGDTMDVQGVLCSLPKEAAEGRQNAGAGFPLLVPTLSPSF